MNLKSTHFAAKWLMIMIYAIRIDAQISSLISSRSSDARQKRASQSNEDDHFQKVKKVFKRTNFHPGEISNHLSVKLTDWIHEPREFMAGKAGNDTKTTKSQETKAPSTNAPTTEASTTAKPVVIITTKKVVTTKAAEVTTKNSIVTTVKTTVTTKKPSSAPTSNPAPGVTQNALPGGQSTEAPKKAELKHEKKSLLMYQLIVCGVMFVLSIIAIVTSCMAIRDLNKTKKRIHAVQTIATTTITA